MNGTVTYEGILFCLLVAVGVFLIIMLYNLILVLRRVSRILDSNSGNIKETIAILPHMVKNVNDVAVTVKEDLEAAKETVSGLQEAAISVSEGAENAISIIKVVGSVVSSVLGAFKK